MSQPKVTRLARPVRKAKLSEEAPQLGDGAVLRVDEAHGEETGLDRIEGLLASLPQDEVEAVSVEVSAGSLEVRAQELADQLLSRRRDLDQRETRLNRQLMLLDQERQAARLAMGEQERALAARLEALAKREKEAEDQLRRAALAEEALRHEVICARENLEAERRAIAQETQLHVREQERLRAQSASLETAQRRFQEEVRAKQEEVDAAAAGLQLERKQFEQNTRAVLLSIEQKHAVLEQSATKLANDRKRAVEEQRGAAEQDRKSMKRAKAEYLRLSSEVEQELQTIAKQRAAHEEDCRNERRRLLLERETMQQELSRERSDLTRRQAALEDAQAALQKTQTELSDQQRAILEERLAVEQVMQALGRQGANQNGEALASARQKLAEHYRWMKESLQTQKSELLEIARQLDAREHLIAEDREGLQQWAQGQQEELDAQLVGLEAQRQQIQRREAELGERELRWALQKKGLEARLAIALARAA
jgi:hypothetical protein